MMIRNYVGVTVDFERQPIGGDLHVIVAGRGPNAPHAGYLRIQEYPSLAALLVLGPAIVRLFRHLDDLSAGDVRGRLLTLRSQYEHGVAAFSEGLR